MLTKAYWLYNKVEDLILKAHTYQHFPVIYLYKEYTASNDHYMRYLKELKTRRYEKGNQAQEFAKFRDFRYYVLNNLIARCNITDIKNIQYLKLERKKIIRLKDQNVAIINFNKELGTKYKNVEV